MNQYVIAGVIAMGAGVSLVSWWLIRTYRILIIENNNLRDEIVQQDLVTVSEYRKLVERLNEREDTIRALDEYIDSHQEWAEQEEEGVQR